MQPGRAESVVAVYGEQVPFTFDVPCAEFAARRNVSGEGIGWFAAKLAIGWNGRARGIEAEMILAFPIVKYCLTTGCRSE